MTGICKSAMRPASEIRRSGRLQKLENLDKAPQPPPPRTRTLADSSESRDIENAGRKRTRQERLGSSQSIPRRSTISAVPQRLRSQRKSINHSDHSTDKDVELQTSKAMGTSKEPVELKESTRSRLRDSERSLVPEVVLEKSLDRISTRSIKLRESIRIKDESDPETQQVLPRRPTRASAVESSLRSAQILAAYPGKLKSRPEEGKTRAAVAKRVPATGVRARPMRRQGATLRSVNKPLNTETQRAKPRKRERATSLTRLGKATAKRGNSKRTAKKLPEEWSYPCRETEFNKILRFIEDHILNSTGGCMLIEGVPGTGKTATVHQVIKYLRWKGDNTPEELPYFQFCEINGIKLSDPKMTYVHLAKVVLNDTKKLGAARALRFLDQRYRNPEDDSTSMVVLLDEMDKLSTAKKQNIIYNLLDWTQLAGSQLIVIAISNTMDLPEKMLMARIDSRIGTHRLSFDPYKKNDLPEIVRFHLKDANLAPDAMILACMRIAAKTGDARGVLDIVRRARNIAAERASTAKSGSIVEVLLTDVSAACDEMDSSPKFLYMKNASELEKVFLKSMTYNNEEGADLDAILERIMDDYTDRRAPCPTVSMCLDVADRLCALRIIAMTPKSPAMFDKRLDLLCNVFDVNFALKKKPDEVAVTK